MSRCCARSLFAGLVILPATLTAQDGHFQSVIERAQQRAADDYVAPVGEVPSALAEMDYSAYQQIRFRRDAALWAGDPHGFSIQFFHPGFLFTEPVTIHVLDDGSSREIPFDPDLFRYDRQAAELESEAVAAEGFAGFRLHYPINDPDVDDEIAVFLGASYFRLVGEGQVYGLSSRGLAIDTVTAGSEEFPAFRSFWLERPADDADAVTVYALLDSPSVTGAYRFRIRPQPSLSVDVDKHLFAREDVDNLGVAPLTSMFDHGQPGMTRRDDFRPRVHDSDGLQVLTRAGEWIWRPLINPARFRVTQLRDSAPAGFGLFQRERDFSSYLDLEAQYHRRPSQWVEPAGDWGEGGVELVEIPSDGETNDNIVAYWAPDTTFRAGEQRHYAYRLLMRGEQPPDHASPRVIRSRTGWAATPGEPDPPPESVRRFAIDFHGEALGDANVDELEAGVEASRGEVTDIRVVSLPEPDTVRVTFRLAPDGDHAADMRVVLANAEGPVSETWNFVWYPDEL